MKALGKVVIVLLLVAAGSVLALRAGLGETDRAAAIERWAGPPSKFVRVDGVPIHVVEEDVRASRLWRLPPYDNAPMVDVHLVHDRSARQSRAERTLLANLRQAIAATPISERTYP